MLSERLRDDTRTLHDRIERTLGLLDGSPTAAEYRAILKGFYGYYDVAETRLGRIEWGRMGFTWPPRRKTPLLERDLLAMGETQASLAAIKRCPQLPPLETVPQALGCMYVMEGATLGGQVITRRLRGMAGLTSPPAFFDSYGQRVGEMWQSFREFLTTYAKDRGEDDVIVASACATFTTLDGWLASGKAWQ